VIVIVWDVLFTAAVFVEILRNVVLVDLDFIFGYKLTQKLDRVPTVNSAVASARLADVTLLIWTQFGAHLCWYARFATVCFRWLFAVGAGRPSKAVCSCFQYFAALRVVIDALTLYWQVRVVGTILSYAFFWIRIWLSSAWHLFGLFWACRVVNNLLCYCFYDTFNAGKLAKHAGTQTRFILKLAHKPTENLVIWDLKVVVDISVFKCVVDWRRYNHH